MKELPIKFSKHEIIQFCQRWSVRELSVFGSLLRDDFDPLKSDVDILIDFMPDASWSLFDHLKMQEELEHIFKQRVDLVTKRAIEKSRNEYRKREILDSAKVVYDAAA